VITASLRAPAVVFSALLAGIGPAKMPLAAGFAIKEQLTSAQGTAFAGASAAAEDISYMFFIPAALARHDRPAVRLEASHVAPGARFRSGRASTLLGQQIGGRDRLGDAAEDALVPAFYAMLPLSADLRLGLGINAPFGQETRFPADWIGRYHALRSELRTVNLNPALAFRVNRFLTLGAGLQIQRIETALSNAIDFGMIGAAAGIPGAVPAAQNGEARVRGEDWSLGFNLGLLASPAPGTRVGLTFRSRIDHELEGRARFQLDQTGTGAALAAASGRFTDSAASARTTLPATVSLGGYHELDHRLALMAELAWTSWSDFDELRISFANPDEPDNVTEQGFKDTMFAALGLIYRRHDAWSLRGGIAYDEGATRDRFRTPRLPGNDRYWLSLGLRYAPTPAFSLDLSLTRIWVEDGGISLTTDGIDNRFRGNLQGRFENQVEVGSLALTWRF
jgi:long-chain fatty acid transport protein